MEGTDLQFPSTILEPELSQNSASRIPAQIGSPEGDHDRWYEKLLEGPGKLTELHSLYPSTSAGHSPW